MVALVVAKWVAMGLMICVLHRLQLAQCEGLRRTFEFQVFALVAQEIGIGYHCGDGYAPRARIDRRAHWFRSGNPLRL